MKARHDFFSYAAPGAVLLVSVFFAAAALAQTPSLGKTAAHNLVITPDTVLVSEPFTITWDCEAPGDSTHFQIWYDVNGNGALDAGVDYKFLDTEEDNDPAIDGDSDDVDGAANGQYTMVIPKGEFFRLSGTLIFRGTSGGVSDEAVLVIKPIPPSGTSISGTVTFPANTPHIAVVAWLVSDRSQFSVGMTDSLGHYSLYIPDSIAGNWLYVNIEKESSPTDAVQSLVAPAALELPPFTGVATDIDLAMTTPAGWIYGDVLDDSGSPVLKTIWMGVYETTTFQEVGGPVSGSFQFAVSAGTYSFWVDDEDIQPEYMAPDFQYAPNNYEVTITSGDSLRKNVVFYAADDSITGTVYVDNNPAPGKRISAWNGAIGSTQTTADQSGNFTIYVSSKGSFWIGIHPEDVPSGYYLPLSEMIAPGTSGLAVRLVPVGITVDPVVPDAFKLEQNYPNPFNPATTIRFSLPKAAAVTLTVYDVTGREVTTLAHGAVSAGVHTVTWDGTNRFGSRVASGLYFYRLKAGAFEAVNKILLVK